VFDALLYLPVIIPDVTMAVMMLLFYTQAINLIDAVFGIQLSKGLATITLSHIAFSISFVSQGLCLGRGERTDGSARHRDRDGRSRRAGAVPYGHVAVPDRDRARSDHGDDGGGGRRGFF
jgi:hypothetical protein